MKISEHEIAQAAKRLRDEENANIRVRQWQHRKMSIPLWLIYLPAATLVGFVFGWWIGGSTQPSAEMQLVTKSDTVYIKQLERIVEYDTIYKTQPSINTKSKTKYDVMTGVPVTNDNTPYHLLVMQ